MADGTSDRTIPPTPRRREAAWQSGTMPGAAAPAWATGCLVGGLLLPRWLEATAASAASLLERTLPGAVRGDDPLASLPAIAALVWPTVALGAAALATSVAVRVACDGLRWSAARTAFDLRRLDPFAGIARIVAGATIVRILGGALGVLVIGATTLWACADLLTTLAGDAGRSTAASVAAGGRMLLPVATVTWLVAVTGWGWVRRRAERRLWMTPEEFAAERRAAEKDPRIRFEPRQPSPAQTAGGR
ncbi:MAG: EscU/YscU/HrcU family type III secretion system export apparatus switch protein [Planctomycetaceae bacterium]